MARQLSIAVDQSVYDPNVKPTQQALAQIEQAGAAGADLLLLKELHNGPYFCQRQSTAEFDRATVLDQANLQLLCDAARKANVVVVSSLFERRQSGLYHNTAVVIDRDGSVAGKYRKMHIPDDPGYHEKFYFTPGDTGFRPIDTSIGRLGVLICWDQWFPEAARLMALAGAEVLLYPTAIGYDPVDPEDEQSRQLQAWQTVQRGHAVANGLPIAVANRCGFEQDPGGSSGIEFWGHSFVCGPQGEFLAHAEHNKPELLLAQIDLERSESVRRIWPFLRDRRIDQYGDLLKRSID